MQIFRKIAVAKLANKRLVAYQRPGADPGEDVGDASPHQPFSTMLWINKVFLQFRTSHNHGCKSMEGCIPPNNPAASPQYFHVPKMGVSAGDDLFLAFTSFWAKKLTSGNDMTFFFGLHFIVGTKLDICRRVNLATSSPPISKNGRFC